MATKKTNYIVPTHTGKGLIRTNPLSMNEELVVGLLAAGAIAGGGFWWYKKNNPTVTVAPGAQTVNAKLGGTVTLKLPAGATWVLVGSGNTGMPSATLAAASGNAPYPVPNVTNGEVIGASYKDSAGVIQASSITVVAA